MTERQQFATIMENEAAPTGGRLASPEVIGGKSNRHSGEKGAPQAPFFHAFFRVVAGRFGRRGAAGRFGRKGRGGRPFFMPFFGWWLRAEGVLWGVLGEGALRGRGLLRRKRRRDGVRAGGGWSRGVRAPFFVVWGTEPPFSWGRSSFLGEGIVRGSRAGSAVPQKRRGAFGFFPRRRARTGAAAGSGGRREGGGGGAAAREREGEGREKREGAGRGPGEEEKRKKRSAILPNASYGGSFVSR